MNSPPNHRGKVLHVLAPAREGGLERVVTMVSSRQLDLGVHVAAVLTPQEAPNHPFVQRLDEQGVPVTTVAVPGRGYLREYRALKDLIATTNTAIVHTHGYRADVIGGAAARARGLPAVSTVHGFVGGSRRNRFYEWLQVVALRRAHGVIAVSAPLVQRLERQRVKPPLIHLIPNAYAPDSAGLSRTAARQKLGLGQNELIIGWVGRLSREKAADVMLDALALIPEAWRLSVIGDGPERDRLRLRAQELGIAERVTWHGPVANAGTLFRAFDAFVLSSRTEGTPIVLFEAMNASVPIIATRVGGVPDVLASATALLVPTESPDSIHDALAMIQLSPQAARERSSRARERLFKNFGVDEWIASIERVYRTILA